MIFPSIFGSISQRRHHHSGILTTYTIEHWLTFMIIHSLVVVSCVVERFKTEQFICFSWCRYSRKIDTDRVERHLQFTVSLSLSLLSGLREKILQ